MSNANDLMNIKNLVEEALTDAAKDRWDFKEAIFWENLHCVSVQQIEDQDGDCWRRILIAEASPSAAKLQTFVRKYLHDRGIVEWVQIETEW